MRNLVGAPIPPEMASEVLRIVDDIRGDRMQPGEAEQLVDLIGRMTEAVMRHFFVTPTRAIGLGAGLRGVVELGVNSSVKTLRYGLKKVIPKLNREQLGQLAQFLDESLHQPGAAR